MSVENVTKPSAPVLEEGAVTNIAPVVEATVAPVDKPKFEWLTSRLLDSNQPFALRVLSLFAVIPTAILDLGRRLAFSVGLIDGKSWSLIEVVSGTCAKVSAAYQSYMTPKELTPEEQNALSQARMDTLAEKLIGGYDKLNGGYFHTNSSFSSPYALEGEAQIRAAKQALAEEVYAFVSRNATTVDDFLKQVDVAEGMVEKAVAKAAGDQFYIANKVERTGSPALLRDVAFKECLSTFDAFATTTPALDQLFIELADRSGNFAANLKKGVEAGFLKPNQAKEALEAKAQTLYVEGLETGIQQAEKEVRKLLKSAVKQKLVNEDGANAINSRIQPEVELLAEAAAKDVLRSNASDEAAAKSKLTYVSLDLQKAGRLKDEEVSTFLTSAEQKVLEVREANREEIARLEAERAQAAQKAADQTSLLGQFNGMLDLIERKQKVLSGQFEQYDAMEKDRLATLAASEEIRKEKVTIRGEKVTILQAASEYFAAQGRIQKVRNARQRKDQMDALANQGFTQATVDRIMKLDELTAKLTALTDQQVKLTEEIGAGHAEISHLIAVFKVFRKNHLAQIEDKTEKDAVVSKEAAMDKRQTGLNSQHLKVLGKDGLIDRARQRLASTPVDMDPDHNGAEVETILNAERIRVREAEEARKEKVEKATASRPEKGILARLWDQYMSVPPVISLF